MSRLIPNSRASPAFDSPIGKPVANAQVAIIAKDRGSFGEGLKIYGNPYEVVRIGTDAEPELGSGEANTLRIGVRRWQTRQNELVGHVLILPTTIDISWVIEGSKCGALMCDDTVI